VPGVAALARLALVRLALARVVSEAPLSDADGVVALSALADCSVWAKTEVGMNASNIAAEAHVALRATHQVGRRKIDLAKFIAV